MINQFHQEIHLQKAFAMYRCFEYTLAKGLSLAKNDKHLHNKIHFKAVVIINLIAMQDTFIYTETPENGTKTWL